MTSVGLFSRRGIFRFTSRQDVPLLLVSAVLVMASSVGAPLETYFYGKIFDNLGKFLTGGYDDVQQFMNHIGLFCVKLLIVALARMVLTWLGIIGWLMTGERAQVRGRTNAFKHLLSKDLESIESQKNLIGSLTQLHRCIEEIRVGIAESLGLLVQACSSIVFLFITSMISLWSLTLVVVASSPLMAASTYVLAKLSIKYSVRENHASAAASKVLNWCFNSGVVARVLNGKYYDLARFSRNVDSSAKAFTWFSVAIGANSSILRMLSGFIFVQGLLFAKYLVSNGKANAGQVFTSFSACLLLGALLTSLADLIAMINKAQASSLSIELLGFAGLNSNDFVAGEDCDSIVSIPLCSSLALRNIRFRYLMLDTYILKDVSARFDSSRLNFVVGLSGSGKSTLASIISGLYQQFSGDVLIDGFDSFMFATIDKVSVVTLIDLSPAMFLCLMKENITLGCEPSAVSLYQQALRFAELENFERMLPDRSDTIIEGKRLSGGETQKFGLARAFLMDPHILILDEAMSDIDVQSRKSIMARLRANRRGKLTIIITHDGQDIFDEDQVLLLKSGKVEAFGKASDLRDQIPAKMSHQPTGSESPASTLVVNDFFGKTDLSPFESNATFDLEKQSVEYSAEFKVVPLSIPAVIGFCLRTSKKKYLIFIGAVASVATGLTPPVLSFLFSQMLSKIVGPGSGIRSVLSLMVPAIILLVADGGIHFLSKICLHYTLELWIVSLRKKCLALISDQDMSIFSTQHLSASDLTTLLMNDTRDLRNILSELLPVVLELISLCLGAVIWSMVVAWKLTFVGFSFVFLSLVVTTFCGTILQVIETRYKNKIASLEDFCHRAFTGIKTVKSLGLSERMTKEYEVMVASTIPIGLKRAIADGFGESILQLCTTAASTTILYYGVRLVSGHSYTLEQMLLVLTMLMFTIAGISSLLKRLPAVSRGQRAAQLIERLLSQRPLPIETGGTLALNSRSKDSEQVAVAFNSVCYSYASANADHFKTVLRGATFHIKKGESVALLGPSGSGKSTIAALLLRLYDTDRGSIEVFGRPAGMIRADDFRSAVTMVVQKPQFFEGTIRENLIYGTSHSCVSDEAIGRALKAANVTSIIERLPKGLDTCYGNEVLFSLGELQRLCIARALVRKPRIIVFDEPTSHLDEANTKIVVNLMQHGIKQFNKDITVITITHDPNIMRIFPRVLVVDKGQVGQDGTFEQLRSTKGPLQELLA